MTTPPRAPVPRPAPPPGASLLLLPLLFLLASSARGDGEPGWMFDPTFREGPPEEVLSPGPPPLLRAHLDAFVDFTNAAFDVTLPRAREQAVRDALENAYNAASAEEREAFVLLVAPLEALREAARAQQGELVEAGLRSFRRDLDRRMGEAPAHPAHELLRDFLLRSQEIAFPGTPPVEGGAAEAWLEIAEFLVSLARNEDVEPTAGQRGALRGDLATRLPSEDAAAREALRRAHRTWNRLQGVWDRADEARRRELRWAAVGLVANLLEAERAVEVPAEGDLPAYARAAGKVRGAQPAFEAWTRVARRPPAAFAVLEVWLGPEEEGPTHPLLDR